MELPFFNVVEGEILEDYRQRLLKVENLLTVFDLYLHEPLQT